MDERRPAVIINVQRQPGTNAIGTGNGINGVIGSRFTLAIREGREPDLRGQLDSAVARASTDTQGSAGDPANTTLSAQGELATNYIELRGRTRFRRPSTSGPPRSP